MELVIEPDFWELFPGAMIGVVVARGIESTRAVNACAALLSEQVQKTASELGDTEISSLSAVVPWRSAYQAFGVKPWKVKSSFESLLRSAAGGRIRSINPLVDLYNTVSLAHRLPCGGEDLAAIVGSIRLTRAKDDELFVPLGSDHEEPPPAGAIIYRDDLGVICSCWNWREAERTKLTEATTGAFLCIEALPPVTQPQLRVACDELAGLVERYLGGETNITLHTK